MSTFSTKCQDTCYDAAKGSETPDLDSREEADRGPDTGAQHRPGHGVHTGGAKLVTGSGGLRLRLTPPYPDTMGRYSSKNILLSTLSVESEESNSHNNTKYLRLRMY